MFTRKARSVEIRMYKGHTAFQKDANRMVERGYEITEVNGERPNVAIGKTLVHTLFTGGIGLAIGGRAHKRGQIMVTYRMPQPSPTNQTNVSVFVGNQDDYHLVEEGTNTVGGALIVPQSRGLVRAGVLVWRVAAVCLIAGVSIALIAIIAHA